jgi:hypothetical protein
VPSDTHHRARSGVPVGERIVQVTEVPARAIEVGQATSMLFVRPRHTSPAKRGGYHRTMPADQDHRWTCPWCQYDLSGLPLTSELRCPECGRFWEPPEAGRRPRPGLALLIAAIPSALTLAFCVAAGREVHAEEPDILCLALVSLVPCGIGAGVLAHRPRGTHAGLISAATGLGLACMLYFATLFLCTLFR